MSSILNKPNGIITEMTGLSGMNQFGPHNSPSRGVMMLSQFSQHIALCKPETRLALSGFEKELLEGGMHITLPKNSEILYIIPYSVGDTVIDVMVIYLDKDINEIDLLIIPRYGKNDKHFGFDHRWTDSLTNLQEGQVFSKETKLTKTNSETSDGVHGYGVHANTLFSTNPGIGEDAVIISKSFAKKLSFKLYETKIFEFGKSRIPINLYGDDNEYKIMPDIGEYVDSETGIIVSLRSVDETYYGANMSRSALQKPEPIFDHAFYSKHDNGKVIDIRVLNNQAKNRSKGFAKTYDQINRYAEAQQDQRMGLIEAIREIERNYPKVTIGNNLHVESVNAMMIEHPRVTKVWNRENLDLWRVEVTIEHTIVPGTGYKVTTIHGSKGIIGEVRDEELMPYSKDGVRTEMIIDTNSTMHRMNLGNSYEGYITSAIDQMGRRVVEMLGGEKPGMLPDKRVNEIFDYILGFIKIIDNPNYKPYFKATMAQKRKVIGDNPQKVYIPINNPKIMPKISHDILNSEYRVLKDKLQIPLPDGSIKESNAPVTLDKLYIMLLYKIADTWLSVSSSSINALGVPIAPSKSQKERMPYSAVPTKTTSESETRQYIAFCGRRAVAEIRDRANNPETQREMYETIMTAEQPLNIDSVVDRSKRKFGKELALQAVRSIIRTFGEDFVFKKRKD